MVDREFKLSRSIQVGDPAQSPIPSKLEKNDDGSYILPDFESARRSPPDRKYLEQGAKGFVIEARAAGAKNIGNLVSVLAKWNIEKYELLANPPDIEKIDDPVDQLDAVRNWELRLFHSHIRVADSGRGVIKQLHNSDLYEFDERVMREMPAWACIPVVSSLQPHGDYSEVDEYMQVFAILNKFSQEDEVDAEQYDTMSTLLHKVLNDPNGVELGIFIKSFFTLNDDEFTHTYKKHFVEGKDAPAKRIYQLFSDYILQTYQGLMDTEDPRHLASRRFVNDFINSPYIMGKPNQRAQTFTTGAIKRGIINEIDEFMLIKNLYIIAEEEDDDWYYSLAEEMRSTVDVTSQIIISNSEQLSSYFPEKQTWSNQQCEEINGFSHELSVSDHWVQLAKSENIQLARPTDFVTARVKRDGDILFVQLFFIHDQKRLERMGYITDLNDVPMSLTTFAIDLNDQHPALYLRLLEENYVDESLQGNILALTHHLMNNTVEIKNERLYKPTAAENFITRIQAYDVAPTKQKGKAQMERGKHKRQKKHSPSAEQDLEPAHKGSSTSFLEEVEARRLWPQFILTDEAVTQLQEKFNDSDIRRIHQKLQQANRGAGLVKTYPNFEVHGKTTPYGQFD